MVRSLVLDGYGINCAEELHAAYHLAGAEVATVHLKDIFSGDCVIDDYDIINFPGGFSFGDDLGAGRVLANTLKYRRMKSGKRFIEELQAYVMEGKHILGICNGFQTLIALGLLPRISGEIDQELSLVGNSSGHFEDRWVRLKVRAGSNNGWFSGLDLVELPVRHAEGRLIVRDSEQGASLLEGGHVVLQYCDESGEVVEDYPANPNGSYASCAALTDQTGRVLGMMPHPEAFLSLYNHPDWCGMKRRAKDCNEEGAGLSLFRGIVESLVCC
ncbi:Phosphoribosylformylglycinamidine synthase subunit PurQ [Chlamydiales bacterium SCGC AG-110-M15]|nr:Phosphoribosylformylglycinamidine synthase subunit PurQ [Chlamydiales bacterium SCGC AG-110-M15]